MAGQVPVASSPSSDPTQLFPDSSDALLVAGQALATWVDVFNLPLPPALAAGVTVDLDFLGDREAAMLHHRLLSGRYQRVELLLPKFGDVTPNTAKMLVYADDDAIASEIDYLGSICGYRLEDEARLRRRAIAIEFPGADSPVNLRVMHPFDCLKSRVHNLGTLPAKQNARGVAQAELAIEVQSAYFSEIFRTEHADLRQLAFPMAEVIVDLACSTDGVRVFHEFGVDVMRAINPELFPHVFQQERWPRALAFVERRRLGRNGGKRLTPSRELTPRENSV